MFAFSVIDVLSSEVFEEISVPLTVISSAIYSTLSNILCVMCRKHIDEGMGVQIIPWKQVVDFVSCIILTERHIKLYFVHQRSNKFLWYPSMSWYREIRTESLNTLSFCFRFFSFPFIRRTFWSQSSQFFIREGFLFGPLSISP